ncbi:MAG: outer membrane protein transport protein [Myxococcota bacterium]
MRKFRAQIAGFLLSAACLTLGPQAAKAGGYDVPILYTARYAGMAGTGISFVDGGAGLYLNPAGLGQIGKGNIDLSVSIVDGQLRGTPTFLQPDVNVKSERTQLPFPFIAGGGRLTKFMTVGAGAFVVGGAGGEYEIPLNNGEIIIDKTDVAFFETAAGVAFNVDKIGLRLGASYRITIGRLRRDRPDPITNLGLSLNGVNFTGFRVGLQWQPNDVFSLGVTYRNKLRIDMSGASGTALAFEFDEVFTELVFPARLGGGMRFDIKDFAVATDVEWIFNSQNQAAEFTAVPEIPFDISNTFDWSDQLLVRVGFEYRFLDEVLPVRAGFIFESTTTSAEFPNAFQPPPAPAYLFTLGLGYNHGPWRVDAAYGRGFSKAFVEVDTSGFLADCPNCGGPGPYKFITANHFVFDFSYNWR